MRSKLLADVPEDKVFYLYDGRILKNLLELKEALEDMEDYVFNHHVNPERNDFCNWIEFVILDKDLANELRRVKTKQSTIKKIKLAIVRELKKRTAAKEKKTAKKAVKTAKKTVKKKATKKKTVKKKATKKKTAKKKSTVKKAAKKKASKKTAK